MPEQQKKHTNNAKKDNIYGPVATKFGADNTGGWRLERPDVDLSKCIECKTCEKFCPTNVISVNKDSDEEFYINFAYCKGCGVCVNVCPVNCMEMIPEGGKK